MGFAAMAGYVDAIGFLKSGGLFVSFMSGNSTRLAVETTALNRGALLAGSMVALFVTGVVVGVLAAELRPKRGKAAAASAVMMFLIAAAAFNVWFAPVLAIATLCMAMGASNAVLQRNRDVAVGLTYMTGTLVKLGYRLVDALRGREPLAWLPYMLLWSSLVIGGIAGATVELRAPQIALWIAVLASGLLTIGSWRLDDDPRPLSADVDTLK